MSRVGIAIPRTVWSASAEQFYTQVLHGLEDACMLAGHTVLSQVADTADQELEVLEDWARRGAVDLVVLKDLGTDDPRPAQMRRLGLPFLVIGDVRQKEIGPGVLNDNGEAMTELLAALAGMGHRQVAHVSGPTSLVHTKWRREAYLAFVHEHGTAADSWVGDYSGESGARALEALLARDPAPSAIVFDNDVMAIAACERARELGIDIPGQLSIIAWDDTLAAQLHDPPLAVLAHVPHQTGFDAGVLATRLLSAASTTLAQEERWIVHESPDLLVRGTVASPRAPLPTRSASIIDRRSALRAPSAVPERIPAR